MTATAISAYLQRIKFKTDLKTDLSTLRSLQRHHLLNVPFENLDIHLHKPITLDTAKFYNKIVNQNRGGFCYELNSLFNELLSALGFMTTLVSARAFNASGKYGNEFDHLALIVELKKEKFLADVGFGEFSFTPLKVKRDIPQKDKRGIFKIEDFDEHYLVVRKEMDKDNWNNEYLFSLTPRVINDFTGMCNYHQTSPGSHFTQKMLCSIPTRGGRITLTNETLKITTKKGVTETPVHNRDEFKRLLKHYFDIDLGTWE